MDPAPCSGPPLAPRLASLRRLAEAPAEEVPVEEVITGGRDPLLHPKDDPLVHDCVELFHRTANEKCKEDFDIHIVSATMGIVDGFVVRLLADIVGASGKHAQHKVNCVFEEAPKKKVTEALEDVSKKAEVEEEEEGLVATVVMTADICEADVASSVPPELAHAITLAQEYGMGELSLYKGYGHVNEDIPMWPAARELQTTPDTVNLVTEHPACFPGQGGRNVVRNQGNCGSCWAFASASSLMTTLCVSKEGAHSSEAPASRFEVSVQRILSCNPQELGCNGGYANAAGAAFRAVNVAKESTLPYQCASGNPLNHFEEASSTCVEFPWGAPAEKTCAKEHEMTRWHFLGAWRQANEAAMARALAKGSALYVTMMVPESFMRHRRGVFAGRGEYIGGHALASVGYGVEGGTKYWILQNSWGPTWAENGYCKFKRGVNLHNIENGAVSFLGATDDADPVPEIGKQIVPASSLTQSLKKAADKLLAWITSDVLLPGDQAAGTSFQDAEAVGVAAPPSQRSALLRPAVLVAFVPLACVALTVLAVLGQRLRSQFRSSGTDFIPMAQDPPPA